jgi:hypothetical protein
VTAARTAPPKTAPKAARTIVPKKAAETVMLKTVFGQPKRTRMTSSSLLGAAPLCQEGFQVTDSPSCPDIDNIGHQALSVAGAVGERVPRIDGRGRYPPPLAVRPK